MRIDRRRWLFANVREAQARRAAMGVLALVWFTAMPAANAVAIAPERIISEISGDWNGDGSPDRAYLVPSESEEDQADLLIELSGGANGAGTKLIKRDIAWHGGMDGTQPSLSVNERGSLVVTAENDAIGRDRWQQKLTILYRNQKFVVGGFTYTSRDTLDPGASVNCDANFLTGRGIRNGKAFRFRSAPLPLMEWSQSDAPKECKLEE